MMAVTRRGALAGVAAGVVLPSTSMAASSDPVVRWALERLEAERVWGDALLTMDEAEHRAGVWNKSDEERLLAGLGPLDAALDVAVQRTGRALDALLSTPATSAEGVMLKLHCADDYMEFRFSAEDKQEREFQLVFSALEDAKALVDRAT